MSLYPLILPRHSRIHNNPNSRRGEDQHFAAAHQAAEAAVQAGVAHTHMMPPPARLNPGSVPGSQLGSAYGEDDLNVVATPPRLGYSNVNANLLNIAAQLLETEQYPAQRQQGLEQQLRALAVQTDPLHKEPVTLPGGYTFSSTTGQYEYASETSQIVLEDTSSSSPPSSRALSHARMKKRRDLRNAGPSLDLDAGSERYQEDNVDSPSRLLSQADAFKDQG